MDKATRDDLTILKGVGPKLAQMLEKHGVTTFVQIAGFDGAAIKQLEDTGDFKGNNDWAGWVEAAKGLAVKSKSAADLASAELPPVKPAGDSATKAAALGAVEDEFHASPTFLDVPFPPPPEVPDHVLEGAMLVVKATNGSGRRRGGHSFTGEETLVPLTDVTEVQQEAIAADPQLVVKLRLFKPV